MQYMKGDEGESLIIFVGIKNTGTQVKNIFRIFKEKQESHYGRVSWGTVAVFEAKELLEDDIIKGHIQHY